MSNNGNVRYMPPAPRDPTDRIKGPWRDAVLEQKYRYLDANVFSERWDNDDFEYWDEDDEEFYTESNVLLEHKWVCEIKNNIPVATLYFYDPQQSADSFNINYLPQARINAIFALAAIQGLDTRCCKIRDPFFHVRPDRSYIVNTPRLFDNEFRSPYLQVNRCLPGMQNSASIFMNYLADIFIDELQLHRSDNNPSFFYGSHGAFIATHLNSIFIAGHPDFIDETLNCLDHRFGDDLEVLSDFMKHEVYIHKDYNQRDSYVLPYRPSNTSLFKTYPTLTYTVKNVLSIGRHDQVSEFLEEYEKKYSSYRGFLKSSTNESYIFVNHLAIKDLSSQQNIEKIHRMIDEKVIGPWKGLFNFQEFDSSLFGKVNYYVQKQYISLQFAVSVINLCKKISVGLANYLLHSLVRYMYRYKSVLHYYEPDQALNFLELKACCYTSYKQDATFFAGIGVTLNAGYIYSQTNSKKISPSQLSHAKVEAVVDTCETVKNTFFFLYNWGYEVSFKVFVDYEVIDKISKMDYDILAPEDKKIEDKLKYLVNFRRQTGCVFAAIDRDHNSAKLYVSYRDPDFDAHKDLLKNAMFLTTRTSKNND